MKWNKLYKYPKSISESLKGGRHYDDNDEIESWTLKFIVNGYQAMESKFELLHGFNFGFGTFTSGLSRSNKFHCLIATLKMCLSNTKDSLQVNV